MSDIEEAEVEVSKLIQDNRVKIIKGQKGGLGYELSVNQEGLTDEEYKARILKFKNWLDEVCK